MQFINVIKDLVIPILGLVISITVHRQSVKRTMLEFLTDGNSENQKKYRQNVYDAIKNLKTYDEKKEALIKLESGTSYKPVSQIISFYETWGLLQEKHYLPIYVFKGSVGLTAVRLFYYIKPYIDHRRNPESQGYDENYGSIYENLEKRIKDKYHISYPTTMY